MKMEPSESTVFADLVLTIPAEMYKKDRKMFDGLKKGNGIKFEAIV